MINAMNIIFTVQNKIELSVNQILRSNMKYRANIYFLILFILKMKLN